jgi:hypothetical protein
MINLTSLPLIMMNNSTILPKGSLIIFKSPTKVLFNVKDWSTQDKRYLSSTDRIPVMTLCDENLNFLINTCENHMKYFLRVSTHEGIGYFLLSEFYFL